MKKKDEIKVENEALETSEAVKKEKKVRKPKIIKNHALFKRGGYAIAITAAVMAGIIVLNMLMSALAERIPLEYDMTLEKSNSMSEENIEYIKGIDKEVTITVCATEEDYLSYISYAAQEYGVADDYSDYYSQTLTIINKYDNYNRKIKINFVDTQDTEFTNITAKYPQENLGYGDLIVTCKHGETERYKVVSFQDIYALEENEAYAMYGTYYDVTGNNIETALTGAIAYVTSSVDKKALFITGHSKEDFSESYQKLLKDNNYEVDVISDSVVTEISSDYDAIFIVAPTTDFIDSELDIISSFLDNDGKYDKGLVYFADAASPYLENLSAFLAQWGIGIHEGIVFETNSQNYIPDEPTVFGSYPNTEVSDEVLNSIQFAITGLNVPISQEFEAQNSIKTTPLMQTLDSVVEAPAGTSNSWTGADKYTKQQFATVMQSQRYSYDDDNNLIENYVFALSSIEFIYGEYSEVSSLSNKNIAFKVAERAVGAEDTGIEFIEKVIENESFATQVTEGSRNAMMIIFMLIIPIAIIAAGIYVYIRRKNS